MSQVLHGIVRGRTIELAEETGLEDGRKVDVILSVKEVPARPPRWSPDSKETAAGMMASFWTSEDDQILAEIHDERKRESRRELE